MASNETENISANQITESFKELLLARAAGSISQEEFERKQALLHLRIISHEPSNNPNGVSNTAPLTSIPLRTPPLSLSNKTLLIIAIVAVVTAGVTWYKLGKSTSSTNDEVTALGSALDKLNGTSSLPPATSPNESVTAKNSGGDLSDAAKRLAAKLMKNPSNGDGWLLLARSYSQLRQPKEAADAYAKAAKLLPPDAAVFADWADSLVTSRETKWDKESADIVSRALATDPKNVKALALAGSEAFSRKDYSAAVTFWTRMKAEAKPDSMDAKLASANISEAQNLLKNQSVSTK